MSVSPHLWCFQDRIGGDVLTVGSFIGPQADLPVPKRLPAQSYAQAGSAFLMVISSSLWFPFLERNIKGGSLVVTYVLRHTAHAWALPTILYKE